VYKSNIADICCGVFVKENLIQINRVPLKKDLDTLFYCFIAPYKFSMPTRSHMRVYA